MLHYTFWFLSTVTLKGWPLSDWHFLCKTLHILLAFQKSAMLLVLKTVLNYVSKVAQDLKFGASNC